jgi:hypothetical protein
VAAACIVVGCAVAGCAAPRQTLGTRSNACFRSLPTAKAAVHEQGRLLGVRRITRAHLLQDLPQATLPAGKEFCVVGFSDDFHRDKVDNAAGAAAAKDAVVIVTLRGTAVVQTWLVDRLPFHMRHR